MGAAGGEGVREGLDGAFTRRDRPGALARPGARRPRCRSWARRRGSASASSCSGDAVELERALDLLLDAGTGTVVVLRPRPRLAPRAARRRRAPARLTRTPRGWAPSVRRRDPIAVSGWGPRRCVCFHGSTCRPPRRRGRAGRGGARRRRVRGRARWLAHRRRRRGPPLGALLGSAAHLQPRRAGVAGRPAGHRGRRRRLPLSVGLPATPPRAPGAPAVPGAPLPRAHGALHGRDGRPRDRAGPRPAVRVLGPHRDRVVPAHRVRPPAPRRAGLGPHGAAGDRGLRRPAAHRVPPPARRVRDHRAARDPRPRRARPLGDQRRGAHRGRRPGQERAGAPALLAAPRDGRPHPRVRLPALGGDGRRRRVPGQPRTPPARDEPPAHGRAARRRPDLHGGGRAPRAGGAWSSSGFSPTAPSPSTATSSRCSAWAARPASPAPASTCWPTRWPRAPCSSPAAR